MRFENRTILVSGGASGLGGATAETIIAAPGTSCRHQIHDGTKKDAKHTLEVLFEALV